MQQLSPAAPVAPDEPTRQFYVDAMSVLDQAGVPYVVGGGYAMAYYTGIQRNTKDLDIFLKRQDRDRALGSLSAAGFRTEFFYEYWIAKAFQGDAFMDILYNSGNGQCPVDDDWMRYSIETDVLGYPTRLCPPEEQLWSKAFVQDRDRFDGADVIHLLLGCAEKCSGIGFSADSTITSGCCSRISFCLAMPIPPNARRFRRG